jgi:hypothetical protein
MKIIGTTRRKIAAAAMVTALTGAGVVVAQSANAATTITVTVKVTQTQCPQGGTVKRVNASITQPGTSGSSGGDSVGGLLAWSGNRSEIIGSNFCQTTWYGAGYYWYWDVYRYLYNNGQTAYI